MNARARHRVGVAMSGTALGVLGVAGAGKLLDLWTFYQSLSDWRLLVASLRAPTALAVPICELAVCVAWFMTSRRAYVEYVAIGLTLSLSTFVAFHLLTVGAPNCQCFGLLAAFDRWSRSGAALLARGAALILLLVVGRLLQHAAEGVPPCPTAALR